MKTQYLKDGLVTAEGMALARSCCAPCTAISDRESPPRERAAADTRVMRAVCKAMGIGFDELQASQNEQLAAKLEEEDARSALNEDELTACRMLRMSAVDFAVGKAQLASAAIDRGGRR
jgi:hypothetical protein